MTLATCHCFSLGLLKSVWITSLAAVAGTRSTCNAYQQWSIRSTWKWQICLNQSSVNQATFKSFFFLWLKTTAPTESLYPALGLNQPTNQPHITYSNSDCRLKGPSPKKPETVQSSWATCPLPLPSWCSDFPWSASHMLCCPNLQLQTYFPWDTDFGCFFQTKLLFTFKLLSKTRPLLKLSRICCYVTLPLPVLMAPEGCHVKGRRPKNGQTALYLHQSSFSPALLEISVPVSSEHWAPHYFSLYFIPNPHYKVSKCLLNLKEYLLI